MHDRLDGDPELLRKRVIRRQVSVSPWLVSMEFQKFHFWSLGSLASTVITLSAGKPESIKLSDPGQRVPRADFSVPLQKSRSRSIGFDLDRRNDPDLQVRLDFLVQVDLDCIQAKFLQDAI